jgi:hypothetical protein
MPSTAYPNPFSFPHPKILRITSEHTRTLLPSFSLASASAIAVAVVASVVVVDEALGRNHSCNLYWDFRPLALIVNWNVVALGVLRML